MLAWTNERTNERTIKSAGFIWADGVPGGSAGSERGGGPFLHNYNVHDTRRRADGGTLASFIPRPWRGGLGVRRRRRQCKRWKPRSESGARGAAGEVITTTGAGSEAPHFEGPRALYGYGKRAKNVEKDTRE